MKIKFLFFTFFLFFNSFYFAHTADLRVGLELLDFENVKDQKSGQDVPTVCQGSNFRIKVSISGSGSFKNVEVVGLENFKVQGTSQSSSRSIFNSTVVNELNYILDVVAPREGTFTIGPARIKQNDTTINSEPEKITLNVVKNTGGKVFSGGSSGKYVLEGSKGANYEFFCKAKVDKANIVVGEPVIFTISTYSLGNILQIGILPPAFPGFLAKEIEKVPSRQETMDGKTYNVLEKRILLLPTKTGDLEIPGVNVNFNVQVDKKRRRDDFFGDDFFNFFGPKVETKSANSNGVKVKVSALPEYKGRVDGVGSFTSFKVEVDKKQAVINEPILLGIEVVGKGNLDQIVSPKLNLPDFFTTYESKTDLQQDLSQDFTGGKKRFEFVLQVSKDGDWDLPEQTFTYFDVASRSYKTFKSAPIKLKISLPPQGQQSLVAPVLPSSAKTDEQSSKPVIKYKKDINFIEESFSPKAKKTDSKIPLWLFLFLLFLPIFFSKKIIAFLGISRLKNRVVGKYGSKRALGKFKNDLDNIIKSGQILKIYPLFLAYFAFKFSVPASEITEDLIEKKLTEAGWQHQKISDFLFYLNQCASLSFASSAKRDFDAQKFLEKSKYWFFMLESKSE